MIFSSSNLRRPRSEITRWHTSFVRWHPFRWDRARLLILVEVTGFLRCRAPIVISILTTDWQDPGLSYRAIPKDTPIVFHGGEIRACDHYITRKERKSLQNEGLFMIRLKYLKISLCFIIYVIYLSLSFFFKKVDKIFLLVF